MSKLWMQDEKTEFQKCPPRLAASNRGEKKTPEEVAGICEVWEERQHWLRSHPELSHTREDRIKFRACNHGHSAQVNGTPEQARAALDLCWSQAYGLPDPPAAP